MNREEFELQCKRIDPNYDGSKLSEDEYKMIEYVYTWYPTISEVSGKEQIANLYMSLGFCIIQDMYSRACEIEQLDTTHNKLLQELKRVEHKRRQLATGRCSSTAVDANITTKF